MKYFAAIKKILKIDLDIKIMKYYLISSDWHNDIEQ